MGDMLVAYEDDVPKNRGLKVSGHCALDTGLGWGNFCNTLYIYNREQKNLNTLTPSRFVGVEGARAKFFLTERDISAPAVCNERGVNPIPLSYSQS